MTATSPRCRTTARSAEPQRGRPGVVSLAGRILSRPLGLRLDLNGVVKGMAVDRRPRAHLV